MDEIFEIINALNRLKDKIMELSSKIDLLVKGPPPKLAGKYVDDKAACKIMRISPRTLAKLRAEGTIPFIKIRRRILYLAADLSDYLDCKCRQIKS